SRLDDAAVGTAPLARVGLLPLPARGEDRLELVGGDDFELRVGAVARWLVGAPAAELGGGAGAVGLHVVVLDLHAQLAAQRLPRQVLALAPATAGAGAALHA